MPKRIANVALTLHREGARININAGDLYDFTKEELEQLKSLNPDAVRLPRNESVTVDHNDDGGDTNNAKSVKPAKQAGPAAGSKAKDEKKASDAGKKEEGSDSAEDGEL